MHDAADMLRVRRRRAGDERTLVACWCAGCGRLWPLAEVDIAGLCIECSDAAVDSSYEQSARDTRTASERGGPDMTSHAALLDGN